MAIQEKRMDIMVNLICVAAGALFVALIIFINASRYDATVDRCTGSAAAYLVSEYVDEYLYAPYHGGRVTTKYTTHLKYSVDIEDKTYSFSLKIPGLRKTVEYLPVKYNPSNPSEFFYCTTELDYAVTDEEWIYYKADEESKEDFLEQYFSWTPSED